MVSRGPRPTAFSFMAGPMVRIRFPPAESRVNFEFVRAALWCGSGQFFAKMAQEIGRSRADPVHATRVEHLENGGGAVAFRLRIAPRLGAPDLARHRPH